MRKEQFERLVDEAIIDLPDKFKKLIENVAFIVENRPPSEIYRRTGSPPGSLILGTYHGVPYPKRGVYYGNIPPDVITIFQDHVEMVCSSEEEIKETIVKVVIHEVGHYFGFDDPELRKIERSLMETQIRNHKKEK